MKKLAKDMNVLTDAELDRMMLTLEAAHAETGNKNVLKVLDIITETPRLLTLKENLIASEAMLSDKCPRCGTRHPLVKEFKYCGECSRIMYE